MFLLAGLYTSRGLHIGKEAWAAELEEEMKMMRFRWGEPEDEQFS